MSADGVVLDDTADPTGAPSDAAGGPTRPAPRPGSVTSVALLIGSMTALVAARPLSDNSFLTHLATGRLIVESGLPERNPFLYSSESFPVPSYWWSVALGWVDRLGGATGLRLLTALLGGVLGVLLVFLARGAIGRGAADAGPDGGPVAGHVAPDRDEAPGLLAVVVPAALAVMCVFVFLSGRPHLLGFVLLAATVIVWQDRRSPWWLVPIFAIWANSHGSWLYGLVVLALFVVADSIDRRSIDRRDVALGGTALLGTLLGGALYPDRFALILLPTRQFGDPIEREALQAYSEWSPVGLGEPMLWMMLGLAILAVYGCVRRRRVAMTVVVVLLVAMGVSGQRLVPIAAIALVPFAATGLVGIGSLVLPRGRAARLVSIAAAVVATFTVLYVVVTPDYRLDRFPVAAADWLQDRDLVARGQQVLTHDYAGNYLEWRYGADANVFVDDRPAAADLLRYADLQLFHDEWPEALAHADPDIVIWQRDGELAAALEDDPDWVVGTRADQYVVLCRAELADACS
ncbi:MAG: hypothetical protein ACYC2O_05405 [Microthrixaceae bacterium]